jgi:hypothetical protein
MAFRAIHSRPMQPKDVGVCAQVIASHPVLTLRYGDAIRHLAPSWRRLLGSEAFICDVFEDQQESGPVVLGAGISVFVTDDFMRALKTPPSFWIGRELTIQLARGDSPVLSDKEVRTANTSDGLNVAVWQTGVLPEHLIGAEVGGSIMTAFVESHRGYRLKEIVTQAECVDHIEALRNSGGLFWNPAGYGKFPAAAPEKLLAEPHVVGMSRDLAADSFGAWVALMFIYQPPRFGFSPSEERLILSAQGWGTDEELAGRLGLSLATIKKTWRAIYERVHWCAPDLAFGSAPADGSAPERGKEKKRRLLAYLREHPEELRPVLRRLLQQRVLSTRSAAPVRSNANGGR